MNIRARPSARGFTLIEIMVALFLLGIVVAAVFSTWMAIMHGTKTGLDAAAAVQRSRMCMRTLEVALTCARSFAADVDYYAFVAQNGNDASLSFVAQLPAAFPRGGKFSDCTVRRVTFSLEQAPERDYQLVLRQNHLLMDLDEDEKNHPVVLARNVKKFEMEFWDKKQQDWLDEWTDTNQLPAMVRVTLQFAGTDPRSRFKEESTSIIALSSVMVQSGWQMPGYSGGGIRTTRPGQ